MKSLRGIISLTMLSFLVAVTGICDKQALALAQPTVVRKKIQMPPESGGNPASEVLGSLSPKADIAQTKTIQNTRSTPIVQTAAAELDPKSDLAATPPEKMKPSIAAQKSPAPGAPLTSRSASQPLGQAETAPADVGAAAAPLPAHKAIAEATAPALSPETSASEVSVPALTVAAVTVPEDRPPSIVTKAMDGNPLPYNPLGKIDPFEPLFKDEPEIEPAESKKEKRVPRTPLERIDLGQLKLVGVILASSGNRALVQESSGKGYIIKEGTYIGVNSGKVTEIKNDRVIVEEEIEDVVGKPTIRNKELVLPKPPGE